MALKDITKLHGNKKKTLTTKQKREMAEANEVAKALLWGAATWHPANKLIGWGIQGLKGAGKYGISAAQKFKKRFRKK
jgi:hypothetical protein